MVGYQSQSASTPDISHTLSSLPPSPPVPTPSCSEGSKLRSNSLPVPSPPVASELTCPSHHASCPDVTQRPDSRTGEISQSWGRGRAFSHDSVDTQSEWPTVSSWEVTAALAGSGVRLAQAAYSQHDDSFSCDLYPEWRDSKVTGNLEAVTHPALHNHDPETSSSAHNNHRYLQQLHHHSHQDHRIQYYCDDACAVPAAHDGQQPGVWTAGPSHCAEYYSPN